MNTYVMKIRDKFISSIKNGIKKHEYRLNDLDRQLIKDNDRLVLISNSDQKKYVNVRIKRIERYKSWEEALTKYWPEDFKEIYHTLDKAIYECQKFYDKDLVDKYGIVVFTIEYMKYSLSESKVLLDTNVLIERESIVEDTIVFKKVVSSFKKLNDLKVRYFVSSKTKEELLKYKDTKVRDIVISKINNGYDELKEVTNKDSFFINAMNQFKSDENSLIDNFLLLQLYNDRCDFLFTNDNGIYRKAEVLYLSDRVINSDKILSLFKPIDLKEYKESFINLVKFKDVNLNDSFFDSLKEDYPGFDKWFKKKDNDFCYVYEQKDGIKGFLYIKTEEETEDYSDFDRPFDIKKKRLKIGTFKIVSTGLRLGERYIQIIIDACDAQNLDEIYVTLYEDKRKEVKALKKLLNDWGFIDYTHKSNGELILVKQLKFDRSKTINENYPLNRENPNYFFLPIKSNFHSKLFPDLRVRFDSGNTIEMACNNALEKIYITKQKDTNGCMTGDVLLIYYMAPDQMIKKYNSCITGTAIFKELRTFDNLDDMKKYCKNRGVFSQAEIKSLFNNNYRTVINLIYQKPLKRKVILKELYNENIIEFGKGPRILSKITKEDFNKVIDLSKK